ncbi:hypothetical protein N7466_001084 [Penicillium verhagenii]|uniref:uncharacterized protein n=1 Tax=Penicillium verhagenii TaxID=1562060 RepID=UPI0025457EF7|nr:uncharacterized protein N7466_001084 [Penicillium verhagenii]KAJ5948069.1 hypothetical protein N7466_001084 [Penicillium verhagenii]
MEQNHADELGNQSGEQSPSKHRGQASCKEVNASCIPRRFTIEPINKGGATNLSHAAIPSYVSTLKRKRDDLNDQIQRQRSSRPRNAPTERPPRSRPASHHRQGYQHEAALLGQDATECTVQAAMGEIGFLSRSAMAEPRDETGGFSEELGIGRMIRAALALSGATPSESTFNPHSQINTWTNNPALHLRRQQALPFLTSFLETIGSQFIHIDSKSLCADFDTIFRDSDVTVDDDLPIPAPKAFVVYVSVATGALLSQESGGLHGLAAGLHQKATALLPGIMTAGNRIHTLHCMLSLILYSMQSPQAGSTWHLVGLAMKKAIAFRFHRDPDPSTNVPLSALIMRRNIFWSLYTVDRTISTIMDRPFNIEDDEITIKGPEEYINDSPHMNNTLARHAIAHARLISAMREGSPNSLLFHYSNLCYWRDFARATKSQPGASSSTRGVFIQLSSRAMVEILKWNGSSRIQPSTIHNVQSLELDIVATCSEYIEYEYQRSDRGDFTGGSVEAYDIFAAGAIIICVTGTYPPPFTNVSIMVGQYPRKPTGRIPTAIFRYIEDVGTTSR